MCGKKRCNFTGLKQHWKSATSLKVVPFLKWVGVPTDPHPHNPTSLLASVSVILNTHLQHQLQKYLIFVRKVKVKCSCNLCMFFTWSATKFKKQPFHNLYTTDVSQKYRMIIFIFIKSDIYVDRKPYCRLVIYWEIKSWRMSRHIVSPYNNIRHRLPVSAYQQLLSWCDLLLDKCTEFCFAKNMHNLTLWDHRIPWLYLRCKPLGFGKI